MIKNTIKSYIKKTLDIVKGNNTERTAERNYKLLNSTIDAQIAQSNAELISLLNDEDVLKEKYNEVFLNKGELIADGVQVLIKTQDAYQALLRKRGEIEDMKRHIQWLKDLKEAMDEPVEI